MYIFVIYDILEDEEGSKVSSKIRKLCNRFLFREQYSVYFGELGKASSDLLVCEIKKIIRPSDKCKIIMFKSNKNYKEIEISSSNKHTNIF